MVLFTKYSFFLPNYFLILCIMQGEFIFTLKKYAYFAFFDVPCKVYTTEKEK